MKLVKVIAAGALAVCSCDLSSAAYPPLDRPTPPPCCADGVCRAHGLTWGVYRTRWRRWPTEMGEPAAPATTPGEKLGPEIPPYEPPPAEEEDRRAPPPTTPKEERETDEADEQPAVPPGATPPTTQPPENGLQTPPVPPAPTGRFPWDPPNDEATTPPLPLPREGTPPAEENGIQTPRTVPLPWEKGSEPTGEVDPPPSLPSMMTARADRAPTSKSPSVSRPPQASPTSRPAAPNDDPPPKLPVVLARA